MTDSLLHPAGTPALAPSASGYGGIEAGPLARINYADGIMSLVWERDFLPMITTTDIDGAAVTRPGQIVQFKRQPQVGAWRAYDKNQRLQHDQVTPESFCLVIDRAVYKSIKVDQDDVIIADADGQWSPWESSFLESAYMSLAGTLRDHTLSSMILETARDNKGNNAGKRRNIQLGQTGQPFVLTADNVASYFARLARVLRDTHRWIDGQMFAVVPTSLRELLMNSNFANAMMMGEAVSTSMYVDGQLPVSIAGFTLIESSYVPSAVDPSGELADYIICGNKQAYLYTANVNHARIVESTDAFSYMYQMQAIYGGKAIYPDALACGYVTITQ